MLAFDIGANRGEWTASALAQGYEVVAIEPGKIFGELVKNFIYNPKVKPLKCAVSNSDYEVVEFYECVEDGLSTIDKRWLTEEGMPYAGKEFHVTNANTITVDELIRLYGTPDLVKIDCEGAEWRVFNGMTQKVGMVAFEWTWETWTEHLEQLKHLEKQGYTQVAPQFIEHHCQIPDVWYDIKTFSLGKWHDKEAPIWEAGGWKKSNLRPTSDVGMLWVR